MLNNIPETNYSLKPRQRRASSTKQTNLAAVPKVDSHFDGVEKERKRKGVKRKRVEEESKEWKFNRKLMRMSSRHRFVSMTTLDTKV
ncbi:hypothetical protein BCU12_21690 [Vibrio sp. 10N.261.55.A7]|nr:hypothetical protein BCU12_21690 [Vibrio sp. 10N.261.55.A7]